LLSAYTAFAAFAYGWIMDFAFWPFTLGLASELSFVPGAPITANLHRFVLFNVATSMGWNLGRALVNMLLVVTLGPAVLRIIRRAGRRASIATPAPASM
ncbi:MAG TPA: ECF transporter S component, partial [Propionibacteriaceae bacterium]|nr:ECF transporter S component [Propionibacteriaceae bacterium]